MICNHRNGMRIGRVSHLVDVQDLPRAIADEMAHEGGTYEAQTSRNNNSHDAPRRDWYRSDL
jgi:hypothetical protein